MPGMLRDSSVQEGRVGARREPGGLQADRSRHGCSGRPCGSRLRTQADRVRQRMTPEELRAVCDSLNDKRGTGGQTKLAGLLRWDGSTTRRKLAGRSKITHSDELAIRKAVESQT